MSDTRDPAIRFGVLGPLRAWHGDSVVDLGPVQQRVVLAVLLLQAGHPISRERLISAVWGEAPPTRAVNLVQRHISHLRRVIGSGPLDPQGPLGHPGPPGATGHDAASRVAWTDAGYLLTVPAGSLDLDEFNRELSRARTARAADDVRDAAGALHRALRLWRGPVCEGLRSPFLDAQRERLAELRISVLEDRAELDLALGQHADLIAELRDLVADHPLRERLRGLLMLALYRAGRQADALAAFLDTRSYLQEELGVEPAEPLQQLHQQILNADPELTAVPVPGDAGGPGGPGGPGESAAATAGVSAWSGRPRPQPAQLPHPVPDFTGRDAELDRLDALAARDEPGTGIVIAVITGTAGVGKTALAVHWAHRMSERFPDGQLYVNLRAFDPASSATEPAEAIRGFLDAFGVSPQHIPARLEAQAALYRSVLAGRRVLVVLDNAGSEDQVRPLLPGSPGSLVIVTSRDELPGLIVTEGAHPVDIDLMSVTEARELLARRMGQGRVLAETAAVDDIIALCARLPLALMLVAARAASHPAFRLSALAAELREAGGSLDVFGGTDQATNVRAVFTWSYQRLSVPGRQLFRLLGLHYGPDVGTHAVVSMAGIPRGGIRQLLAELARANLVTERVLGRFTLHDLLRAYAAELAAVQDSEADCLAARRRMLDYYLHTAYRANELFIRHQDTTFTLASAAPGVIPERPADQPQALAWFEAEHAVLVTAVREMTGFDTHLWQLAWALESYFEYLGHWDDQRESQNAAVGASRRLSDKPAEALSLRLLGCASVRLRSYGEARTHFSHALQLFRDLGDSAGQAEANRDLAMMLERQGRYGEALPYAQQALELFRAAGHRNGEARALNALGWFHTQLGDHTRALTFCEQALDLQREVGDRLGQAETSDSLGYAHCHLGHQGEAIARYQQAIDLYHECGDRYNEADSLASLGDTHQAFGDFGTARIIWRRALAILLLLGHPDAATVQARINQPGEKAALAR